MAACARCTSLSVGAESNCSCACSPMTYVTLRLFTFFHSIGHGVLRNCIEVLDCFRQSNLETWLVFVWLLSGVWGESRMFFSGLLR